MREYCEPPAEAGGPGSLSNTQLPVKLCAKDYITLKIKETNSPYSANLTTKFTDTNDYLKNTFIYFCNKKT